MVCCYFFHFICFHGTSMCRGTATQILYYKLIRSVKDSQFLPFPPRKSTGRCSLVTGQKSFVGSSLHQGKLSLLIASLLVGKPRHNAKTKLYNRWKNIHTTRKERWKKYCPGATSLLFNTFIIKTAPLY